MLTGPPGSAKSWASRQLAFAAGAGKPGYLDHFVVPRRLRVLVIDEDNGNEEEWRREETLFSFLSIERADLARVWRISLAGVQLDQEKWQVWLRGLIEGLELDLVVLDPISEMHGGKELREDPSFRSMLAFLKRLKVDFPKLAVVLVHHTRKRSGQERGAPATLDDVRGQWGQTPDVVAIMLPLGENRLSFELFKRVPHRRLVLEQKGGGLTTVADQTHGALSQSQKTDTRVLSMIRAGASTVEEIRLGSGLSKQGVYNALRRLRNAKIVSRKGPLEIIEDPEWSLPEDEVEPEFYEADS